METSKTGTKKTPPLPYWKLQPVVKEGRFGGQKNEICAASGRGNLLSSLPAMTSRPRWKYGHL